MNDLHISLDTINKTKNKIKGHFEKYENISKNFPAYNFLKSFLKNKTDFINDSCLLYYCSNKINDVLLIKCFDEIIKLLNDSIGSQNNEKWNQIKGDKQFECVNEYNETEFPRNNLLHPWVSEPMDRYWINNSNNITKNYAKIATDIIDLLKYANGTKSQDEKGFQNYFDILDELKNDYEIYLNSYINSLKFCNDISFELINLMEKQNLTISESFSLLDGKFIKNNFKIL